VECGSEAAFQKLSELLLKESGIQISMDGKGRYLDHIWVERFWRTLKYEEVYLNEYANPYEAWQRIHAYIEYFNHQRPHSSLGHATPAEVYQGQRLLH
jgi:putative transposase